MTKQLIRTVALSVALGGALVTSAHAQNSSPVAKPVVEPVAPSSSTYVAPARPPAEEIIKKARDLQKVEQKPAVSTKTVTSPPAKP
jgi:hypothetical protein